MKDGTLLKTWMKHSLSRLLRETDALMVERIKFLCDEIEGEITNATVSSIDMFVRFHIKNKLGRPSLGMTHAGCIQAVYNIYQGGMQFRLVVDFVAESDTPNRSIKAILSLNEKKIQFSLGEISEALE